MLKNVVVAAALIGTLGGLAAPAEAAATVRRHLHCAVLPTFEVNLNDLGNPNISSAVVATNNWTFTIAKNTIFTYTVNNHSYTYKSTKSLAPNATLPLGDARGATSCNVSIPG